MQYCLLPVMTPRIFPAISVTALTLLLALTAPAQEQVSFPTRDGGIVYADLYGQGERGLVLAHGGRFNKESWQKQAPVFVKAGFRVLAIDFRGYGQSHGPRTKSSGTNNDPYEGVQYDVLAAVRYLHEHGAKTVSVIGASFGGAAAAQASAEAHPGEIDRTVLLAAEIDHPEQMQGRKLFIVARDDTNGEGPRLPRIQRQYDRAPEPKEFLLLDGSAHAQFLFETGQGEKLMREILRFLMAP